LTIIWGAVSTAENKPIEPDRVIPDREMSVTFRWIIFPISIRFYLLKSYLMKHIVIFVFLMLGATTLWTQYTVKGVVTDTEGNTLEFASVYFLETEYAAATNESGAFELRDVETGSYTLIANFLGFDTYEANLYVDSDLLVEIVLEGSPFKLEAIEIRGTWAKDKYPFAVKEFTEEELQEQNTIADAPYLLQFAPSVVVSSDAGAGVGYTGIRVRGIDPTRINVTVNGIPLNDAESQSVYWVDLPDVMNSVNAIQLQRGVGTSTNGAGAFGAAINLNTNHLAIKPYAGIEAAIGSFNTKKLSVELGTGLLNDKFTIDGRYSLISSDGYVDRAKSALNSFYVSAARVTNGQSLRFNVFSGHEITYQSWYGLPIQFLETDRTFNAAGFDNDFSIDEPYENEIDNYRQNHLQLFWNKALAENLNFELAGHYTRGKGYFEQFKADQTMADYGLGNASSPSSDLVRRKWLDNHFFGLIFNLERSFDQSSLILGGGIHDYIGRHFGQVDTVYNDKINLPDNYLYYDNDANKLDMNVYSKYQHRFGPLSVLGDLQYRLVNYGFLGLNDDGSPLDQTVTLHFFNPKVGVNLDIARKSKVYASFAVANREPNRDDYTESPVGSRPKPERLYNVETGYRFSSSWFNAGLNGYYMKYKDQLVLTGKLNDVGDYTKINIPDSYRMGLELDVNMKIGNYLKLGGAVTISNNKINAFTEYVDDWDSATYEQIPVEHENTDISFSPPVIASAEIKWDILQSIGLETDHGLALSLSDKYVGAQYLDNTMNETAKLEAYNYLDAKLKYTFNKGFLKNASIEMYVSNLLNSKFVSNGWVYRYKTAGYDPVPFDPYSVADSVPDYYYMVGLFPQATRHYLLKIRLDF
jgi:iron complex outermembrane receptor protein